MSITTIKRCQPDSEWAYTVEDCFAGLTDESRSGLTITYFDNFNKEATQLLAVNKEDALLIRDAINQLYPNE